MQDDIVLQARDKYEAGEISLHELEETMRLVGYDRIQDNGEQHRFTNNVHSVYVEKRK